MVMTFLAITFFCLSLTLAVYSYKLEQQLIQARALLEECEEFFKQFKNK